METYEESVELTRTFVKIESTNPGTEEAANERGYPCLSKGYFLRNPA